MELIPPSRKHVVLVREHSLLYGGHLRSTVRTHCQSVVAKRRSRVIGSWIKEMDSMEDEGCYVKAIEEGSESALVDKEAN